MKIEAEIVVSIKKMWSSGLSAQDIAEAIGGGVIAADVVAVVSAKQQIAKVAKKPVAAPLIPVESEESEEVRMIPLGQRCSIFELTDSKCRWPIGDPSSPDFFFCGGRTIEGTPYCGYHARMAYAPQKSRQINTFF